MLLSNLELLATAPGGVAKLRELILTLAVQGKLVPQDPADEPASVLLRKIRAEKDRLLAEGKIKKDKPLAAVADEEKPFGLPEGWEWVRALDICALITDGDHQPPPKADTGVPFLVIGDVRTGAVLLRGASRFVPDSYFDELDWGKKPFLGDVLYTTVGSFGIPVPVVQQQRFCFQRHIALFRPAVLDLQSYLALALQTTLAFRQAEKGATGTAQKTVPLSVLRNLILPLPPLTEQSRIVTRVEELMRLCDALEAKGQLEATQHAQLLSTLLGTLTASATPEELADNWQRVDQHFDLLLDRPEAIDALEQTLLQLAVRGLLVPQDPADEPASVLLQKIRAEKDRLIAEGQIKRDKPLPPVTDEEKPFELPVGWEWSSLAAVGVISPRNYVADDTFASFVEMRSIPIAFGEAHISESRPWRDIKSGFTHFAEGDVGVAKITPCFENGKSTVFQNLSNGVGAGTTELHVIRPLCGLIPQYVLIFLKSPDFLNAGEVVMTGSAGQKRLPRAYFENTPFPLPPLAEQSRIVARVTQLRRLCADLRQRLAEREAVQARLAEALVASVA